MPTRRTGGYWPGPDHELLLRASLMDGTEAAHAWRRLRSRLQLERVDRASLDLLPLLDANLRCHRLDDRLLDAPLMVRLGELRQAVALRNRILFDSAGPLLRALDEAGVPSALLKGGALAVAHYRDIGLRPMRDLDVLVPTATAARAIEVLGRAGWVPRGRVTPALLRMHHAVDLAGPRQSRCDLHWHVFWECCQPDDDDALWASSVPLDFEDVPTRMLGPADQLLHVLVHGSRRTRRPVLLWVPDAMLVLRAGAIDWERLVAQAVSRRFILRVLTMLEYVRSTFDAPVPDEALARLRRHSTSALERVEYAVINRRQGLLGELPGYWCNYLRIRERGRMPSPLGFSRYLQQTWRADSLAAAARGAARRAGMRVRAAVLGPPAERK